MWRDLLLVLKGNPLITLQLVILALVQGITEFLPISSSAHLILIGQIGEDQGLLMDIAVHVGTMIAVCLYFWRDVSVMFFGGLDLLRGKLTEGAHMTLKVGLATIPVVLAGLVLHLLAPDLFRSPEVIAWATLVFGALLWVSDRFFRQRNTLEALSYKHALAIGLAQALALIPGTSRSGVTMTAARFLGYTRTDGAKFSLLLSIPTIAAAGLLLALDLMEVDDAALTVNALIAGVLAFFSALAAISLMMRWLKKSDFTPFVIYRMILGTVLLWWIYVA